LPFGLIETIENNGYGFFLTETVRMARHGLQIVEIPIHFHDRNAGRSKMPKFQIVLGATNLLHLTFNRQPFDPNDVRPEIDSECERCRKPYVIRTRSDGKKCLFCFDVSR
jgi:dolichol-phosphate mannosyltransferase